MKSKIFLHLLEYRKRKYFKSPFPLSRMKKSVGAIGCLIIGVILISALVTAQSTNPNNESSQRVINGTANAEQNFREKKTEYQQYRIFLFLDSVFEKGSIVSKILFGTPYEFELRWALAIAFWLFFFLFIPGIIRNFSGWNTFFSSVLAFALNIALAQTKIFKGLSLIAIGLISQGRVISFTLFFLMIAILLTFFITLYVLAHMIKKRREEKLFYREKNDKNIAIGGQPPEEDYQRA